MSDPKIFIRPSPQVFFIRQYGMAALAALILVIGGLYLLLTASGPDFQFLSGSIPVMQVVIGLWAVAVILVSIGLIHTKMHQRVYLALMEEELVYEFGIFNHHTITVPFHMITDSQISNSWTDRLLHVSTLQVNTSGGPGYEILAVDFPASEIIRLHTELLKLVNELPTSLPDNLAKEGGSPNAKKK